LKTNKKKKLILYSARPFNRVDKAALIISALLFAAGVWVTFRGGAGFLSLLGKEVFNSKDN